MLDNFNAICQGLNFFGISDNIPRESKINFVKYMSKKDRINICLVHQPSICNEVHNSLDIMFSGHTHTGQIFPFHYFVKMKFKYFYGLYKN